MDVVRASSEAVAGAVYEITRDCAADLSGYDMLLITITACITEGVDTRDEIIRTAPSISGQSHAYVAKILDLLTGTDPSGSEWMKGTDGKYRLVVS